MARGRCGDIVDAPAIEIGGAPSRSKLGGIPFDFAGFFPARYAHVARAMARVIGDPARVEDFGPPRRPGSCSATRAISPPSCGSEAKRSEETRFAFDCGRAGCAGVGRYDSARVRETAGLRPVTGGGRTPPRRLRRVLVARPRSSMHSPRRPTLASRCFRNAALP